MKWHSLLTILPLTCIILSCNESNEQRVSGKIENAEGSKISLIGYVQGKPDTIGTVSLNEKGKFSIPVQGGRLAFYTLSLDEEKGGFVLAFDSTQSPVITADLNTINKTYDVSGSPDSEGIRDVFVSSVRYEQQLDSTMKLMQNELGQLSESERQTLGTAYNSIRKEYKRYLLKRIDDDPSNVANFSILQRLNPKEDLPTFIKVRDSLAPRMSGNTFFDQLSNNIGQLEAQQKEQASFSAGVEAPDIILPNPEGQIVQLSSLKGKYVLVDFWASWCKPCRAENPNVVKLYEKYKNDGFEIYGVSLDRDKLKWQEAIAQDQLDWIHVSDLQFWNSAAAKLYNVRGIPFTVLLDKEGRILETQLRGRALESKLSSIFGY